MLRTGLPFALAALLPLHFAAPVAAQMAPVSDESVPLTCMVGPAPGPQGQTTQTSVRVPQSKVDNFQAIGFQVVTCPGNEQSVAVVGLSLCERSKREASSAAVKDNVLTSQAIAEACAAAEAAE